MRKILLKISLVFLVFFLTLRLPLSANQIQNATSGSVEFVLDDSEPLELTFDSIGRFDRNGLAIVTVKEIIVHNNEDEYVDIYYKFGLINKEGVIILEPIYSEISSFNDHYYLVATNNSSSFGLVSKESGQVVIEPKYSFFPNLDKDRFFISYECLDTDCWEKKPVVFTVFNQKISLTPVPLKAQNAPFDFLDSTKLSEYVYILDGRYLDYENGSMEEGNHIVYVDWLVDALGNEIAVPQLNQYQRLGFSYAINNELYYQVYDNETQRTTIYYGTVESNQYNYEVLLEDLDYSFFNRISKRFDYRFAGENEIFEYYVETKETKLKPEVQVGEIILTPEIIKAKGFFEDNDKLSIIPVPKWDIYLVTNEDEYLKTKAYVMDQNANLIIDEEFSIIEFHESMDWLHLRTLKSMGVNDPLGQEVFHPFDGYYDLVNQIYVEPQFIDFSIDELALNNYSILLKPVDILGFSPVEEGGGYGYDDIITRDDVFIPLFDLKWGIINKDGKIIIEPIYDYIAPSNKDGYFKTEIHGKEIYENEIGIKSIHVTSILYGLFHIDQGLIVEPKYSLLMGIETEWPQAPLFDSKDQIKTVKFDEICQCELNGIITPQGVLFEAQYFSIRNVYGYYNLRLSEKEWEVVNEVNLEKMVFDFTDYDEMITRIDYVNGYLITTIFDEQQLIVATGILDTSFKTVVDFEHDLIEYKDGLWYLSKYDESTRNYKFSVLDENFDVIVPYDNDYDELSEFVDGFAVGVRGEAPSIEVSNLFSHFFARAHANDAFVLQVINDQGRVLGDFSSMFENIQLLGEIDGVSKAIVVINGQSYFATMNVTPAQEDEPDLDEEEPIDEDPVIDDPNEDEEPGIGEEQQIVDDEELLPPTGDKDIFSVMWVLILGLGLLLVGKTKKHS